MIGKSVCDVTKFTAKTQRLVYNRRMKTFIDAHVHVQPWKMMKPEILERMRANRKDMDVIEKVMDSPAEFLKHMDREGVEKTALINYVSPHIMGFTAEVNEFISEFCSADPSRLIS